MRETTMASYGFNGFVLPKMFRAIFYRLYDVTGPNGHFSTCAISTNLLSAMAMASMSRMDGNINCAHCALRVLCSINSGIGGMSR